MEVNSAAGEILHCARQKLLAKNLPLESTTSEHAVNYSITERANHLAKYNDLTEQHEQAETQTSQLLRGTEEAGDEFNKIKRDNLELSENNTILQKALAVRVSLSEQTVNNLNTIINTHHAKHINVVTLESQLKYCREELQKTVDIEGQNIKLSDNIKKLKSTLRLKEKECIENDKQIKVNVLDLKKKSFNVELYRQKVIQLEKNFGDEEEKRRCCEVDLKNACIERALALQSTTDLEVELQNVRTERDLALYRVEVELKSVYNERDLTLERAGGLEGEIKLLRYQFAYVYVYIYVYAYVYGGTHAYVYIYVYTHVY